MEIIINTGFTLNQKDIEFLNEFKKKYQYPKSVVIRALMKYYQPREEELLEILRKIGEENGK